jgi:DnaJ-class molecular chaperone
METMTVNIPRGVNDGGRLRIPGKGGMGPGGTSGDLYLRIHITPHRFFKREGKTLHLDLPVSISEAVLGARVEVPTLDGKATLKVPPQTQNGAVLRMKGKGVPDPKGGAPGDMLVRIQVAVPTSADARTKEFYEELKKLEPDPRRGMF